MQKAPTGGGYYSRRVFLIHAGEVWGVFPAGVYSGAFWGNRCNFRIAVIMAMFGALDRL